MANRINTFLLKRSNIPGKIPSPGQLLLGEIALNSADAMLYTSGTTANSILPIGWDRISRTGDTMSGALYGPTISATTYLNLPISIVNFSNLFSTGLIDTGTNVDSITYSNFFGEGAGSSALYASNSNFMGYQAGNGATNANDSNFMGYQAGNGAIDSNDSNFLGTQAGYAATNAHNSNFIGNQAGNGAISASDSNFIGHYAGNGATNAYNSNFIGESAGHEAINAHQSNFIGNEAGANADNADFSNFMGQLAGGFAVNAGHSNFIGQNAGYQATDASYSNFLGYNAGNGGVLGSLGPNNIIIGTNISLSAGTTDSINLGGVLFGTGTYSDITGNPSIVAQTGGKIGINVVNPLEVLHVGGNALVDGNLTANIISATTYLNLPTDIRVTGGTYSFGTAVFTNNTGGTFSVNGLTTPFTGGTVSGSTIFTNGLSANTISATTYYNLPLDVKVTGSSFNNSTYDLTLTRNDGVTITSNLSILSSDMVVTGGTYNINTGVVTFTNNSGGTFNVTGFTSGMTDTYTTGGTYSNGTTTFTKTNGERYTVSGYTTPFTGGTVTGGTLFNNGLSASTFSAATYLNLPTDIRITGGTYSSGTTVFRNNTGGTFNISGYTYIPHLQYDNYNSTIWNYGFGGNINNISFGENSLISNTSGEYNTAFGSGVLTANTIGTDNTGIGNYALNSNITGDYNTGIGSSALQYNTYGVQNFAIGAYSLYSNTTGSYNTGIGVSALENNIVGERNISIGGFSLYQNIGSRNIAIGFFAGSATLGNDNILFGSNSNNINDGLVSGSNNTIIGTSVSGIINGSNNTIFGKPSGLSSTTTNNIVISDGSGNIRFRDNNINTILPRLAGSGDRMVIAGPNGELSTKIFDTFTGGTVSGATIFTNGLTANTFSATSINKVDYMVFNTSTVSAATVPGTVYFDNTEKALSYNTSINQGVTVNLGQQNYVRVINNSGVDIQRGKALELLTAYNGLPAVTLAINRINGSNIIGVSSEVIPNNSEGIAITNGIISDMTLTGMSVGSLVYASDIIPGELADATKYFNFPLTARTNQIGYVIQTGATTGKLFVTINNENTVLSLTDLQRNVLEGNSLSTGLFDFTGMTLSTGNTFNVSKAKGWIIDNTTNPLKPDAKYIEYSGQTGLTTPYLLTDTITYVLINSGATITFLNTFPTPQQRRQNIYLGKLGHANKTSIINIFNEADFDVSPISQLRDMFTPIKLINSGVLPSPNGANLNIDTSAGTIWGMGIGFTTNQLNPNSLSVSGTSPTTFQYRTQTGGTSSNTTTIIPGNYDLNGVITAIGTPVKQATNQRIYLLQNGQIRIQYGQKIYGDLTLAVAAAQIETFNTFTNFRDNAILIGILSTRSDTTNLSDPLYAQFLYVSKFGEVMGGTGGLSTTTLQQAYNNSSNPEIIINSTLDGLTIQNGTGNADNITRLLEGSNTAANITSFIRADGYISGTTFQTNGAFINNNGITATTVSATTYLGLPTDVRVTGGTYSAGTAIFSNNTGGTFSVTGFSTSTSNGTTFTGGTVSGATIFISGLTANTISATTLSINGKLGLGSTPSYGNSGQVLTSAGSSASPTWSNLSTTVNTNSYYNIVMASSSTSLVTGTGNGGTSATLNPYTGQMAIAGLAVYGYGMTLQGPFGVGNNPGSINYGTVGQVLSSNGSNGNVGPSWITPYSFTGGTVTGATIFTNGLSANTFSATTYYNLPLDVKVTGSSLNPSTYDFTLTRNDGVTITSNLALLASDMTVTGGTYDINTGIVTFTNNTGATFNVTGFTSGMTDTYTTGGTVSSGTATFTKSNGGTYTVSGFATQFTGGTITGGTFFNNGLSSNTFSATTYLGLPNTLYTGDGSILSNRIVDIGTNTLNFNSSTYPNNLVLSGGNIGIGTASPSEKLEVSGNTKINGELTLLNSATNFKIVGNIFGQTYLQSTSGALVLNPGYGGVNINGANPNLKVDGNITVGNLAGTGTRMVVADSTGLLSTQNINNEFTGGTVNGSTIFTNGLSANTISATTYLNLPTDVRVTGGTYSAGTAIFSNNTGGTFSVTGFSTSTGGGTTFTGGTVNGSTTFTNGLSADTISATTIQGGDLDFMMVSLFRTLYNY